jgi:hypothetical protein
MTTTEIPHGPLTEQQTRTAAEAGNNLVINLHPGGGFFVGHRGQFWQEDTMTVTTIQVAGSPMHLETLEPQTCPRCGKLEWVEGTVAQHCLVCGTRRCPGCGELFDGWAEDVTFDECPSCREVA